MPDSRKLEYVTVSTRNYLPAVEVLARSLKRQEPGAIIHCYLVEREVQEADLQPDLFGLRSVASLNIPDRERFFFQYNPIELCCALKPYILLDAMQGSSADYLVYLDGDTKLYHPIDEILEDALREHSVALTPHLLTESPCGHIHDILRSGVFNAGVLAVRADRDGERFLRWWAGWLDGECISDPYGGILYDQRWLDLAVGLFPFTGQVRHAGMNVGYWNLHERKLERIGGRIMVNGNSPLCIFHFTGATGDNLSRHIPAGYDFPEHYGLAEDLAREYREEIAAFAGPEGREYVYSFGHFDDGEPIRPAVRELVRREMVDSSVPFREREKLEAALPAQEGSVFSARASHWVETGPKLAAELNRIWDHPFLGAVLRLWQRFVNPDLKRP